MTDYWGYADFDEDGTHRRCRSNPIIINTGNPHMQVVVNPVGTLSYNENNTITGTVKSPDGTALSNIQVTITIILPRDKTATFHTTTNSNGVFTQTFLATRHGEYIIYATAAATNDYSQTDSEEIITTTNNLSTVTTISTNYTSVYVDNIITLTVNVKDENNNSIQNMDVAIYDQDNNIIAQRKTTSQGTVTLQYKLDTVKTYKFHAKAIANTLYTESTSSTITVVSKKHILTTSIESSTLYTGWTARIYVENENNKPTANTKFYVTINNQTSSIISDSDGFITTPALNTIGTQTIKIEFAGNEKYNTLSKNYTITVKGSITTQLTPKAVENTQTAIPYKTWANLSNMLVGGEGKYGEAGTGCTGSTALAGRNGSRKIPAPLRFTNLAYDIPTNANLEEITIYLKIRTLSCSSDSANIGIAAPTVSLLSKSKVMDLPTSNAKLPYKEFGLVTATLDLSGINVSQLNNTDTGFTITFPANTTTNTGRVQIDHVYTKIKYTPTQEGA